MTAINVTSVNVLDNPSPVTNPLQYVVVVVVSAWANRSQDVELTHLASLTPFQV